MYTQSLPPNHHDWSNSRRPAPDLLDDDYPVTARVKAYVFGDRFLAKPFKQTINRRLVSYVIGEGDIPAWLFAAIYAFQNLPADDIMLKFFIDVHCRY